jgi:TM2 domain-containing membrane protein YozV
MLVAREHVRMSVACPHCQQTLEPWRLAAAVPPTAPAYPGVGQHHAEVLSLRNRWVAGTLGVLLGEFGVHRFYLGFVGIGLIQIFVTLVTCGIGGIWGFIEGILCFCGVMRDVDGLPLRS